MSAEEVIFQHTVEGLFVHGIPRQLTPQLRSRVKTIGIDLDRKLDPAYLRAQWDQVLAAVREEAFAGLEDEEAYLQLGRRMVMGYTETLVGRALAALAKVLGPRRTLARMTHNLRSASNFSETRMKEGPEGAVDFWVNEPRLHPSYFAGLLQAAVEVSGGKEIEVTLLQRDAEGCAYRLQWK